MELNFRRIDHRVAEKERDAIDPDLVSKAYWRKLH